MAEKKFDYYIKGEKGKWEVIIGLEVHAQVLSKSKLFSSSPTKFGAEPNTQVSLVDSAFPGMLPVINQFCIEQRVKTGLGLKAKINLNSVFDRKNYFYADLPQGYQISQYKNPIVGEGEILLDMPYGTKKVGILKNLPSKFEATRYHSLIIDKKTLSEEIEITAETENGIIMGIEHKEFNVHGVQFHPESIKTTIGIKILKNFINYKK